jgi:uncharacterized membrane protein YjgN (DUF898 family)
MENSYQDTTQETAKVPQDTRFEFRGNATDFFAIWFVNLLLSLITLGIYSPWAKVRNNQYIYGNTFLGEHPFEYTAKPFRILIGRAIVIVGYAAFFISARLDYPAVGGPICLLFILALPFLIRQAIVFRMKYTRFHGLNFKCTASVRSYYGFFALHFLLIIITLGFILPYTLNRFKKLIINNANYGDGEFYYDGGAGSFYMAYLKVFLVSLAVFPVVGILMGISAALGFNLLSFLLLGVTYLIVILYSLVSRGLLDAWIGNAVYNNTVLKDYKMTNSWKALPLAWIYLSNFFILSFTLGLMYPWTKIRLIRYKLKNIGFESLSLDDFSGEADTDKSALGEETADFFDFDIGF